LAETAINARRFLNPKSLPRWHAVCRFALQSVLERVHKRVNLVQDDQPGVTRRVLWWIKCSRQMARARLVTPVSAADLNTTA
jgi:hypothetical protein